MTISMEEVLRPPTEAEVELALSMFAASVREAYGQRLRGLYLFGSRARGDHEPHSDADVAVLLCDEAWELTSEKRRLARLAVEAIVATGVHVQGWPVSLCDWSQPERSSNARLIENMRRDGRSLMPTP